MPEGHPTDDELRALRIAINEAEHDAALYYADRGEYEEATVEVDTITLRALLGERAAHTATTAALDAELERRDARFQACVYIDGNLRRMADELEAEEGEPLTFHYMNDDGVSEVTLPQFMRTIADSVGRACSANPGEFGESSE